MNRLLLRKIRMKWHILTREQNGHFKWYIDGNKENRFNNVALVKPITALQGLISPRALTTNIFDTLTSDEIDFVIKYIDHLLKLYK